MVEVMRVRVRSLLFMSCVFYNKLTDLLTYLLCLGLRLLPGVNIGLLRTWSVT